jgi:hypothetical protein
LPLHCFDFVVGPFQGTGGYGVIVIGQDAIAMAVKRISECNEHFHF